ncbi:MAG: anthranilate synthase component I, partial [Armatimonadetes bacterium]|nr:anthranilate synthase component I [Armatimonadota bacterium]NIM66743.1 anthranilate synthase component I [Armatimonadota bacterium]NIO98610.1 anthranilate synthase component I [Armatimonadota bacterium]
EAVEKIEALVAKLNGPLPEPPPQHSLRNGKLERNVSPQQFKKSVLKAKDYIAAGDAIQVVLSQRLSLKVAS